MIFLFRKEIQKWNKLWWIVIAGLLMGGSSLFFLRMPDKSKIAVATIDGEKITLEKFHQTYAELRASVDGMARAWGIPAEQLAALMGLGDLATGSLNRCIQEFFLDRLGSDFSLNPDDISFQDALAATVSKQFFDPRTGKMNMKAYEQFLQQRRLSIREYENKKEGELKRGVVTRLMQESAYVPSYVVDAAVADKNAKKSFSVLTLPLETFLAKVKEKPASEGDLKKFYRESKENYRVGKKRKVNYWTLTAEEYKDKVEITDKIIEKFYERNKSTLYRIPPKVKVRHILFDSKSIAKAEEVHKLVKESPERFAELATKYSQDPKTASKGGLTDFFQRGTHDAAFEKAAFLLLKKKGDISDIVKTEKGLEIIMLEERIPSSAKPLDKVRSDVIKALKDRRALYELKSDIEAVMRTARTDETIFQKFAKQNELKTHETDWITKEDVKGHERLGMIAQKLFSAQGRSRKFGYFVHRGEHIIYHVVAKEKSYIPEFAQVKETVQEDWYKKEARKVQKESVKKARAELFKTKDVEGLAKKYGYRVITLPLVSRNTDKVKWLEGGEEIVQQAFVLTDPSQVFLHKRGDDQHLIMLKESKVEDSEEGKDSGSEVAKSVKMGEKGRCFNAFIASLQRNATIEVREEMLK